VKFSKNKEADTAIALFLALTIAVSLALPIANAHDPSQNVPTYAYVTATPSPVGVNEQVIIVMWLNWPPPTAAGTTGDRWQGYKIDITKPDGNVEHLGPFVSDPVGSAYTLYTPDQLGEYKVNFTFPSQILERAGYTGLPGSNSAYIGDNFTRSTAETAFTVQQEPIKYWQQPPLPVSYWTRPIDSMNTNWYVLASNWLGQSEFGLNYLRYQTEGRAPDTAHVMWTKPLSFGGVVGGDYAINTGMTFYSGTAYQYRFANPLILYGRLYYNLPVANSPAGGGYACVDLRTGEEIWKRDFGTTELRFGTFVFQQSNSPSFGQFYDFESPNQHGTNPNGYLWTSATVIGTGIVNPNAAATTTNGNALSASTSSSADVRASGWIAIDPMTGVLLFNETDVPSGTRAYGPQGEWLIYNIGGGSSSRPYTYLWQWNNTKLPGNDVPGGITQWLPGNSNWNMSKSYDWNVTLSEQLPAGSAIIQVWPGDMVFGRSTSLQFAGSTGGAFGTPDPYTLWAVNLNESRNSVGKVMWIKNYTGSDQMTILIGMRDQETHVFTTYYKELEQWNGYSLLTGEKLWGPTASENPFNFYGGTTGLTAPYAIGYGNLYSPGYGGVLYCYDFKTGQIVFTYGNDPNDPKNNTRTPETAYGDYPYQVAAVADGKVYLISSEHSLNAPPFKGAEVRCVNATTGEEIWKLIGMCNWQEIAVADGYFVFLNYNDMRIYCVGPGPSATEVAASPSVITQGDSVLITGSVTDQSPNTDLKGTAAISDADQGPWMDYMIMKNIEMPNVKGVDVSLDTVDPNGNYVHIATVTSDSSGNYGYAFTPDVPGTYQIIATFAGSGAYGPSSSTTYLDVGEAPPATAPPEYPQPIDPTMTIVYAAVAIIIAIIIAVILVGIWIRRK
jgi:outer membrane protein assembly factor BamB